MTTDKDEFLEKEFPVFESAFKKDKEKYINIMSDCVKACMHCGILYWAGCSKRCDCNYGRK